MTTRLTRDALEHAGESMPAAPERIVHIGVGAFHRAHQAWYTSRATDSSDWGIVGFTGRGPAVADQLSPQQGVYTLVERGPEADSYEHVGSIVRVEDGRNVADLVEAIAAPRTAVVTLTVTEIAYRLSSGGIDLDHPEVASDVAALRAALAAGSAEHAQPASVLGRLLLALVVRARRGAGPLAVVPCDNLPDNGGRVRNALLALAEAIDDALPSTVDEIASFVSTSIDRITPRTTAEDIASVAAATGWEDASPVITEPFSSWVLAGDFPAGRPDWESAGAQFVDEIAPVEARKLWMLNGAHSLLASAGLVRGHSSVSQAIGDPVCLAAVEALWDEDARHLPVALDAPAYRAALLERFRNPRIVHLLEQIETDSITKLSVRVAPVAALERNAGRSATGCAGAIGAWVAAVRAGASSELRLEGIRRDSTAHELVAVIDGDLAADGDFVSAVEAAAARVAV